MAHAISQWFNAALIAFVILTSTLVYVMNVTSTQNDTDTVFPVAY